MHGSRKCGGEVLNTCWSMHAWWLQVAMHKISRSEFKEYCITKLSNTSELI